jgi:hypothetical protein
MKQANPSSSTNGLVISFLDGLLAESPSHSTFSKFLPQRHQNQAQPMDSSNVEEDSSILLEALDGLISNTIKILNKQARPSHGDGLLHGNEQSKTPNFFNKLTNSNSNQRFDLVKQIIEKLFEEKDDDGNIVVLTDKTKYKNFTKYERLISILSCDVKLFDLLYKQIISLPKSSLAIQVQFFDSIIALQKTSNIFSEKQFISMRKAIIDNILAYADSNDTKKTTVLFDQEIYGVLIENVFADSETFEIFSKRISLPNHSVDMQIQFLHLIIDYQCSDRKSHLQLSDQVSAMKRKLVEQIFAQFGFDGVSKIELSIWDLSKLTRHEFILCVLKDNVLFNQFFKLKDGNDSNPVNNFFNKILQTNKKNQVLQSGDVRLFFNSELLTLVLKESKSNSKLSNDAYLNMLSLLVEYNFQSSAYGLEYAKHLEYTKLSAVVGNFLKKISSSSLKADEKNQAITKIFTFLKSIDLKDLIKLLNEKKYVKKSNKEEYVKELNKELCVCLAPFAQFSDHDKVQQWLDEAAKSYEKKLNKGEYEKEFKKGVCVYLESFVQFFNNPEVYSSLKKWLDETSESKIGQLFLLKLFDLIQKNIKIAKDNNRLYIFLMYYIITDKIEFDDVYTLEKFLECTCLTPQDLETFFLKLTDKRIKTFLNLFGRRSDILSEQPIQSGRFEKLYPVLDLIYKHWTVKSEALPVAIKEQLRRLMVSCVKWENDQPSLMVLNDDRELSLVQHGEILFLLLEYKATHKEFDEDIINAYSDALFKHIAVKYKEQRHFNVEKLLFAESFSILDKRIRCLSIEKKTSLQPSHFYAHLIEKIHQDDQYDQTITRDDAYHIVKEFLYAQPSLTWAFFSTWEKYRGNNRIGHIYKKLREDILRGHLNFFLKSQLIQFLKQANLRFNDWKTLVRNLKQKRPVPLDQVPDEDNMDSLGWFLNIIKYYCENNSRWLTKSLLNFERLKAIYPVLEGIRMISKEADEIDCCLPFFKTSSSSFHCIEQVIKHCLADCIDSGFNQNDRNRYSFSICFGRRGLTLIENIKVAYYLLNKRNRLYSQLRKKKNHSSYRRRNVSKYTGKVLEETYSNYFNASQQFGQSLLNQSNFSFEYIQDVINKDRCITDFAIDLFRINPSQNFVPLLSAKRIHLTVRDKALMIEKLHLSNPSANEYEKIFSKIITERLITSSELIRDFLDGAPNELFFHPPFYEKFKKENKFVNKQVLETCIEYSWMKSELSNNLDRFQHEGDLEGFGHFLCNYVENHASVHLINIFISEVFENNHSTENAFLNKLSYSFFRRVIFMDRCENQTDQSFFDTVVEMKPHVRERWCQQLIDELIFSNSDNTIFCVSSALQKTSKLITVVTNIKLLNFIVNNKALVKKGYLGEIDSFIECFDDKLRAYQQVIEKEFNTKNIKLLLDESFIEEIRDIQTACGLTLGDSNSFKIAKNIQAALSKKFETLREFVTALEYTRDYKNPWYLDNYKDCPWCVWFWAKIEGFIQYISRLIFCKTQHVSQKNTVNIKQEAAMSEPDRSNFSIADSMKTNGLFADSKQSSSRKDSFTSILYYGHR